MSIRLRHLFRAAMLGALALATLPALAQQPVRVGSKNFTEQFVLAELYAQAMEAAGIKVERKINLGGTLIAHKALEEKQIDFYPEYTGTMLLAVLKQPTMTDRKAVYEKVKAEYATKGLSLLNEAPVNNTYNMVVRPETAAQYKLETLSDLAKVAKELKLGAGPEFRDRKDGLPGPQGEVRHRVQGRPADGDRAALPGDRRQADRRRQRLLDRRHDQRAEAQATQGRQGTLAAVLRRAGRAQGSTRRQSEDRGRAEPRQRTARRSDDGGNELQGRRREDGAEGRRRAIS